MSGFHWITGGALALILATPAVARDPCRPDGEGIETAAAAVRDGRTLQLTDGRELRLAGIEASESAREALHSLVEGQTLHLQKSGGGQDRYGRLVGFVFVGKAAQPVQQDLIERGQARVSARVGEKSCADALLAAEREARLGRRGLWADPNFAPLPAEDNVRLGGERGHFVIVEGNVLSVRESGATVYVNFGRRWSRDFSVAVPRRLRRAFSAAGHELNQLAGRRVRVRGFVEVRRGPVIEADAPEQIELVERPVARSQEARP